MSASMYITEQGATVHRRGERIEVRVDGVVMQSIRCDELDRCVVVGNVGITTPAVQSLMRSGSDVVFLTREGRFIARLSGGLSKNVFARLAQFRALEKPERALELARRFVAGKIENQRRLLLRQQRKSPRDEVAAACARLRHLQQQAQQAGDLDELRGLEGSAARDYFGCFGLFARERGFEFSGRLRRPPPDPVNVLLSFGYTMLGNLVHADVEAAGLDPYLGSLHRPRYGRPSLVLDLMEEFRPVAVDSAVLAAINTRAVTGADFERLRGELDPVEQAWEREELERAAESGLEAEPPPRPLVFRRRGVKKWLATWERTLARRFLYPRKQLRLTLRQVIRAQVEHFSECLQQDTGYEPFVMPY